METIELKGTLWVKFTAKDDEQAENLQALFVNKVLDIGASDGSPFEVWLDIYDYDSH
jgi:hypothetical protein